MIACSMSESSVEPATSVPGSCENDDRTRTAIPYRLAYSTDRRCSTFAPHAAISSISSYVMRSSRRAFGTIRGSAEKTPSTSV